MDHLNYSRQLTLHCKALLQVPSLDRELRAKANNAIDLHGTSTKFMLPDGGRLFDDYQFRALDENVPLRLPYPYIALEYRAVNLRNALDPIVYINGVPQYEPTDAVTAPKRVLFARERDDWIVITVAFWTRHDGTWRILPECAIPNKGYLDRSQLSDNGRALIKFMAQNSKVPLSDYADELGALLCFLNALQCANVHIERSAPKKQRKVKAALPFDTYHVLTIDAPKAVAGGIGCSHRSPREHLRRGHIRRYENGSRIWVNATVVNAGIGGRVSKDYRLAA